MLLDLISTQSRPRRIYLMAYIWLTLANLLVNTTLIKEKTMKKTLEIRPAEGGTDSQLFVTDLAHAYKKLATKFG